MRSNIFLKSIMRQPARTLLLALLVMVGTFALVARVTEYIIVSEEVARLEGHYRSFGVLSPINRRDVTNDHDARAAAEVISASPFVAYADERVFVQGVLADITNVTAQLAQSHFMLPLEDIDILTIEHYFYATVRFNDFSPNLVRATDAFIHVIMDVSGLLAGDPSLLRSRSRQITLQTGMILESTNRVDMRLYLTDEEVELYESGLFDPFGGLSPNDQFLFRAIPIPGIDHMIWIMRPLIEGDSPIFFANADDTDLLEYIQQDIDIASENMRSMLVIGTADMENMPRLQNPFSARLVADTRLITGGRWLSHQDHLEANHVAVVSAQMATRRGLRVGETFTISLMDNPRPSWIDAESESNWSLGVEGWWEPTPQGWWATTEYRESWQSRPMQELELEVVGIYWNTPLGVPSHNFLHTEMYIPASLIPVGFGWDNAPLLASMYSFVLHSPRDEAVFIETHRTEIINLGFGLGFLPNGFASFVEAADPIITSVTINLIIFSVVSALILALVVFLYIREWRKAMAISRALGSPANKTLRQLLSPVTFLWLSSIVIGSILAWFFALSQAESTMVNLTQTLDIAHGTGLLEETTPLPLMSWFLLLAIVLTLITTGEIMNAIAQWRKNAITTSGIGRPLARLWSQLSLPIFPMRTPVIIIGTAVTWFYAIESMEGGFADITANLMGTATVTQIGIYWLLIITAGIILAVFGGLGLSALLALRRPVLVQLQGGTQKRRKPKSKSPIQAEYVPINFAPITIDLQPLDATPNARRTATFKFVLRHILRSPIKSALIALTALTFVLSLGWLNHIIIFTEQEINRMWDTTVISAETITTPDDERLFAGSNAILSQAPISPTVVNNLTQSGYMQEAYLEALWIYGFLRPETDFEHFEEPQGAWWEYTDLIFGVNDLEGFVKENSRTIIHDAAGVWGEDIVLNFTLGFDMEDFAFDADSDTVPVLLRSAFLEEHGYNLGDYLVLDYPAITVQIIGSFDHGLSHSANRFGEHRSVVVMPLAALEYHIRANAWHTRGGTDGTTLIQRGDLTYMTARIDINPSMNREIEGLNEIMAGSLINNNLRNIGDMPLELLINDQELRNVIEPMEQNLAILRLLYPIAIAAAAVMSLGLSLLLSLQNAKNAAIIRILGKGKAKTHITLWGEQAALNTIGVILGITSMLAVGVAALEQTPLALATMYLIGSIVGAAVGVFIIISKTPLELMQVQE